MKKTTWDDFDNLESDASEIDGNILYGENLLLTKKLRNSQKILIAGDSITYGVGVSNELNLWSLNFKKLLSKKSGISSLGFVSANDYSPSLMEHTITVTTPSSWTKNYLNGYSNNGFSYDTSVLNQEISFYTYDYNQTRVNVHYVKPLVDSVYEVYINGVLASTINEIANGTRSEIMSSDIAIGTSGNTIKVKLVTGTLAFIGVTYRDTTSKLCNVLATGGRRIIYMTQDVINNYKTYDSCIFALGYNDVKGGSTTQQQEQAEAIIDELAQHYIDNNKLFIYVNFIWDTSLSDNWVFQRLLLAFGNYPNFYNFDYRGTILDTNGLIADDTTRRTILLDWNDYDHPNSKGSERIFKYMSNRVFNEYTPLLQNNIRELNGSLVSQNSSVTDAANNSVVFGLGNRAERPLSSVIGAFGVALNASNVRGQAKASGKINQVIEQLLNIKTTNATETYLRDCSNSALYYQQNNTIAVYKGYIVGTDRVNNLHKEFQVDCKIINTNGLLSLIGTSEGYPANGIVANKGTLAVSARIVPSGSNNSITFRVTGLASTTIEWQSKIEVLETSIDY